MCSVAIVEKPRDETVIATQRAKKPEKESHLHCTMVRVSVTEGLKVQLLLIPPTSRPSSQHTDVSVAPRIETWACRPFVWLPTSPRAHRLPTFARLLTSWGVVTDGIVCKEEPLEPSLRALLGRSCFSDLCRPPCTVYSLGEVSLPAKAKGTNKHKNML